MNVHGRLQRRNTFAARDCDVNAIRDDVRQAMAGEGGDETEGTLRDAMGDFEKVMVGRRGIGPSIQAARELFPMKMYTDTVYVPTLSSCLLVACSELRRSMKGLAR